MKQDPQGVLRGPSRPRRLATALSFAFSLGQWGLAHYAHPREARAWFALHPPATPAIASAADPLALSA